MNKPKAFFVVSQWNNNIDWIKDYTDDYVIFDKSDTIPESDKVIKLKDVGFNIFDYFYFCYMYYDDLPDVVAFLQGSPWEHINRKRFDELIYNETFTSLEDYRYVADVEYINKKSSIDGGYMEFNHPWYLYLPFPWEHRYFYNYNHFLKSFFIDPPIEDWIRFSPGAQYIVRKENILFYSRKLYLCFLRMVNYAEKPTEACLLERSMFNLFSNRYIENTEAIENFIL
jgi:hypothetical protein